MGRLYSYPDPVCDRPILTGKTKPMVVLHHYPQSTVSEKVRAVLGLKGLDWRSVEIPLLPP